MERRHPRSKRKESSAASDVYKRKILNTLSGENVFVISHKQDALADKFRETIKFEKIRNFSHVAT